MLGMMTAIALAATDPCARVEPAAAPDVIAAAQYRAVAQEEQAAGDRAAAAAAWRLAAENDPSDARSRAALAALCREAPGGRATRDPLQEATRLLDADRYREAAALLRETRRTHPTSDAALLEGICRYELGEDAEAARLFREAETDATHRDTARLYLGLLALRGGSAGEAASLFDAAADNPALSSLARDLARSARWDGPIVASVLLEGGYDSNVRLTTTQPTTGGKKLQNGDAVGGVSAVILGRPLGANGPFVRAAGAVQQFASLDQYDFRSGEAAAGARWWKGGTGVTAEYSFADRTLGGSAYLTTHRLLATGSVGLGPLALSATWWGRWEDYAIPYRSYSGFAQRAEARVGASLGAKARLGVGWSLGRDDADLSTLSWTEQGPRADLTLLVAPKKRLTFEAGLAFRSYDEFDPALGVKAWETVFDAAAAFEWDVARHATLRFSLLARTSDSNVEGYVYSKVVPSAAIGVMMSP
jgi:hypothetical protein